jgi:anti-anti-sigma factor
MRVNTQEYGDVAVVELHGELDMDSAELLKSAAVEVLGAGRTGIVLNMNEVSFIDGVGLETLVWLRDHCWRSKVQLRLAGLDENCLKILEITGLLNEFDRHAELAEAVKSFA